MSEVVNNTEALRAWFRTCPVIAAGTRFGADYVAGRSTEYALYSVPSTLRTHENILGQEVLEDDQTQNFIFVAELPYGNDTAQNLANLGFMQTVFAWIVEQNAAANFPSWEDGRVKAILPTLTGAPVATNANTAKYQIQLKINYRRI